MLMAKEKTERMMENSLTLALSPKASGMEEVYWLINSKDGERWTGPWNQGEWHGIIKQTDINRVEYTEYKNGWYVRKATEDEYLESLK